MQTVDSKNIYFTPLLPWQAQLWNDFTARYQQLPHSLLFAGIKGIGKRAFVWRFVAWALCNHRDVASDTACGHCQSCQWLIAGTHPDLYVLPPLSLPTTGEDNEQSKSKTSQHKKTGNKSTAIANNETAVSIKVGDIRSLAPFVNQGSEGRRFCVIDNAEIMTIAAANALLKTLEEPKEGVFFLLISDRPTKLLPTIKSRVQQVAIHPQRSEQTLPFIKQSVLKQQAQIAARHNGNTHEKLDHGPLDNLNINQDVLLTQQVEQALILASGAPLTALEMLQGDWYKKATRDIWIKTWLALRAGTRSSVAASDYWQKTLSLGDFLTLTETMLLDFNRCLIGMSPLQQDLQLEQYEPIATLTNTDIEQMMQVVNEIKQVSVQNVQAKLSYDRLMVALGQLGYPKS